jgi:hypothetical protein
MVYTRLTTRFFVRYQRDGTAPSGVRRKEFRRQACASAADGVSEGRGSQVALRDYRERVCATQLIEANLVFLRFEAGFGS